MKANKSTIHTSIFLKGNKNYYIKELDSNKPTNITKPKVKRKKKKH